MNLLQLDYLLHLVKYSLSLFELDPWFLHLNFHLLILDARIEIFYTHQIPQVLVHLPLYRYHFQQCPEWLPTNKNALIKFQIYLMKTIYFPKKTIMVSTRNFKCTWRGMFSPSSFTSLCSLILRSLSLDADNLLEGWRSVSWSNVTEFFFSFWPALVLDGVISRIGSLFFVLQIRTG